MQSTTGGVTITTPTTASVNSASTLTAAEVQSRLQGITFRAITGGAGSITVLATRTGCSSSTRMSQSGGRVLHPDETLTADEARALFSREILEALGSQRPLTEEAELELQSMINHVMQQTRPAATTGAQENEYRVSDLPEVSITTININSITEPEPEAARSTMPFIETLQAMTEDILENAKPL
jgi:hypothetical protein